MIRLPYTGTYSLELVTAQNGAQVVVCYSDATSTAYTGGTQATSITSATTTAICATPAASTIRDVDEINIKNTYAGSHTITVQLDANGTNYPLITAALAQDESLNYTHGSGWQCKDANGNTKSSALTAMTSAQLAGIISDETGSGALVFATSPTLVTPALGTPSSGTVTNLTGTASININGTVGATTPTTGAFTAVSSTGNASLGDSEVFDAHTLKGKLTSNDVRLAAVSASLPALTFVDACFHLAKDDTDKGAWRKRKGQSWRSEARSAGKYLGVYSTATTAVAAGGALTDVYYNTTNSRFEEITNVGTPASAVTYRAGREDYPTNALITAEATRVIIWDLDGAVPSMWMVFACAAATWGTTASFINGNTVSSISAANQNVAVGIDAAPSTGLYVANFMADEGYGYRTSGSQGRGMFNGNIATRNSSLGYTTVVATSQLVSDTVNDVAITVLPDAPVDEYGMPVPTIFVATDAGVSVINNNGTVADLVDVAGDDTNEVVFDRNNNCYFTNETQGDLDMFLASNYDADDTTPDANYDNTTTPALLAAITATKQGLVATKESIVAGHSTGMSILVPSTAAQANGMVAYITSTYNTGYMVGDIRRAIGYDSASALADKSIKASAGIAEVGTLTKTPVSGGRTAVSGFSAANYIQEASHADWNALGTGDFSIILSGVKWGAAGSVFIGVGDGTTTGDWAIIKTGANLLAFFTYSGSWAARVTTTATFTDTAEHVLEVKRISGVVYIVVDGVVVASGAYATSMSSTTALGIGAAAGGSWGAGGQFSGYVRISATAPTAEGSKFIALQENALNSSQTCLLSNSNTVSALSYDKDTDTYRVGNGTNVDTFNGLKRIASAAHGVTTLTALAGGNGRTLTAGTGASYTAPERNISAELLEAQTTKPRTQNYSFTSSGTTQALPKGWKAQGVIFNLTDGTMAAAVQTFDGFLWTLTGLTTAKAHQIQLVEA